MNIFQQHMLTLSSDTPSHTSISPAATTLFGSKPREIIRALTMKFSVWQWISFSNIGKWQGTNAPSGEFLKKIRKIIGRKIKHRAIFLQNLKNSSWISPINFDQLFRNLVIEFLNKNLGATNIRSRTFLSAFQCLGPQNTPENPYVLLFENLGPKGQDTPLLYV